MLGPRTVIRALALLALAPGCEGAAGSSGHDGSTEGDAAAATDSAVQAKDAQGRDRSADSQPVGVTWTLAEAATDKDLYVVIWAGTRFLAVGDGGAVLSSSNGAAWTKLETGISDNLRSLAWTGSRLVAIAQDGKVLTSEDGAAWTERGTNLNKLMRQVAWTGKVLSAMGRDGNTAVSSDGTTWTARQSNDLYTFVPTGAVSTGSELVWGGYNSLTEVTFNEGRAYATKDGVSFTNLSPGYQCNSIFGVAWNDAEAITSLTTPYNGRLIGAGRNGEMFTMDYGHWDSGKWGEGATATRDVHAVIWTGYEAVAVGESGLVLRSTTGHYRNWSTVQAPGAASFNALAWNGERLVAVGSAGTIITSP